MCQRYCFTEGTVGRLLSALTLLLILGSLVSAQSNSPSQEKIQIKASARRESTEAPEPTRTPSQPGAKATTLSESTIAPGKLAKPPRIDGIVEKDEWKGATHLKLTYQIQPGDNVQPSEATEVMLAYDREHLYLLFHASDSNPSAIRAHLTRRDDVYNDDYTSVYLDTFADRRRAYVLYFNPLGIQADGVITGGTVANAGAISDLTWDGIFQSKGNITDDGYVVEISIPFKTLRFIADKERGWRLHLQRWIARKQERISWQPISRDQSELLAQTGVLNGLTDIFTGRTFDLTPTLTGSITSEQQPDPSVPGNRSFNSVNRLEPGLTAIYSVTPNLTISAAVNPDFSQIEADVPQINVNQRFPLFFPERRPFFLEGAEVFRSPGGLTFVDTRQIVDPDWGVKLTGKIGKNTIGALAASDRAPGLQVPVGDSRLGRNAQFTILRYQRDVLSDSRLGFFLTNYSFGGSSNSLIAADGQIRFRQTETLGFQFAHSRTRSLDGQTTSGGASYISYEHRGRHWRFFINDNRISDDYQARTGFVRRTGFLSNTGTISYDFQPKEKEWWAIFRPFILVRRLRTNAGLIDDSLIDVGADVRFTRGIDLHIYHQFHQDGFAGREFRFQFNAVDYAVNTFKYVSFNGSMQSGGGVNFSPLDPTLGHRVLQRHSVTIKPNKRLNSEFLYLSDSINARNSGQRLLRQDIIRNRSTYQFTRSNGLRSIIDYDTARRQIGFSLLYSYTPRPNTAMFLGYNDLLFNGIDPFDRTRSPGLFHQRRTLFTKLSYNFRF